MEIEILKTAFLQLEKISSIKNHIDKLVGKNIDGSSANGKLEIDIAYRDSDNNECFKSLPFTFTLELEGLKILDVAIKNVSVFVVDGKGVNVEYMLKVLYNAINDKEIELVELDSTNNEDTTNHLEHKNDEQESKNEEIEKIKENISKDYEKNLADNLSHREKIAVVTTKSNSNDIDFISFFDEKVSSYYSIKTLKCNTESELNEISKEYKVPMDILLKGFDRANGKVTFKLNKASSN